MLFVLDDVAAGRRYIRSFLVRLRFVCECLFQASATAEILLIYALISAVPTYILFSVMNIGSERFSS